MDKPLILAFLTLSLIIALSTSSAQPEEVWNRTYGGPYNDGGWQVQPTADGGYVVVGHSCSEGQKSDLWLLKVDQNGTVEWERTFGGSGEDLGYSVSQTGNGGYVIAGSTESYGIGAERLWLLKTDPLGQVEWDRTLGGFVSSDGDGGWYVEEDPRGGYVVVGYTRSKGAGGKDLWILKTDPSGALVWERTFGGPDQDAGFSLDVSYDGYLAAGYTASEGEGDQDLYLVKVDLRGERVWNRTFGKERDEAAFSLWRTEDGGYLLAGRQETAAGDDDVLLVKVGAGGEPEWERTFGGSGDDAAISAIQSADGGYILAGRTMAGEDQNLLLVKTDPSGLGSWAMRLGGPGREIGTSVIEVPGGYVVAGIIETPGRGEDLWLVKLAQQESFVKDTVSAPSGATTRPFPSVPYDSTGVLSGYGSFTDQDLNQSEAIESEIPVPENLGSEDVGAQASGFTAGNGTDELLSESATPSESPKWPGRDIVEHSASSLEMSSWTKEKEFRKFFKI